MNSKSELKRKSRRLSTISSDLLFAGKCCGSLTAINSSQSIAFPVLFLQPFCSTFHFNIILYIYILYQLPPLHVNTKHILYHIYINIYIYIPILPVFMRSFCKLQAFNLLYITYNIYAHGKLRLSADTNLFHYHMGNFIYRPYFYSTLWNFSLILKFLFYLFHPQPIFSSYHQPLSRLSFFSVHTHTHTNTYIHIYTHTHVTAMVDPVVRLAMAADPFPPPPNTHTHTLSICEGIHTHTKIMVVTMTTIGEPSVPRQARAGERWVPRLPVVRETSSRGKLLSLTAGSQWRFLFFYFN